MTVEEVEAEVGRLRALQTSDAEAAAAGAEQLRCQVLQAIADGAPDPWSLASAAMVTVDEDIGRD